MTLTDHRVYTELKEYIAKYHKTPSAMTIAERLSSEGKGTISRQAVNFSIQKLAKEGKIKITKYSIKVL
jgi:hypothetical protein